MNGDPVTTPHSASRADSVSQTVAWRTDASSNRPASLLASFFEGSSTERRTSRKVRAWLDEML